MHGRVFRPSRLRSRPLKAERGQPASNAAYFARKMQSALAKLQIA